MKYFVNENCICCGLCTTLCPNVFELTDMGPAIAVQEDIATEDEDLAIEAMESCPANAIKEA